MNNLAIIEYQGSRVLTTAQLAEVYETETKNITDNYGNNSSRFMEGKDFHMLQGNDLRIFKGSLPEIIGEPLKFAPKLILWTSRGANRHCKMLGTDKAWDQFDVLEETYSGNDGDVHIKFKTLVFQKGIDYISKLLKEAEVNI